VRVGPQWHTKGASQTKISQLQIALLVDQQVLGLEITVKNSMSMTVPDALAQLHHELLDHLVVHAESLASKT
jgi:hypothetical protein